MDIGTQIKKARREKELTQERLAESLNISVSAVSQWESGKTLPDIALIPALCSLLGITSDTLLGIDLEKKEARIAEISSQSNNFSSRGYYEKARDILTEGLREFPDSDSLLCDLMYVAFNQHNNNKYSNDEREAFLSEEIRLGERILEGCTADMLRHSAIQILCYAYRDKGETDKAEKLAMQMPETCLSKGSLLASVYSGTMEMKANQRLIFTDLTQMLVNRITGNYKLDDGSTFYTTEEALALQEKKIAFIKLMFERGDYGFYNDSLYGSYVWLSEFYAKRQDKERTLANLSDAYEHAIAYVKFINSAVYSYTSLLFRGLEENPANSIAMSSTDNSASALLSRMKAPLFDFVRNEPEFMRIAARLGDYAGKWAVQEKDTPSVHV